MTAAEVMDRAGALLNDTVLSVYTYIVQQPFLNQAIDDLKEEMQLNNVSVTNVTSAVIPITAGSTLVTLPVDLIEIRSMWERQTGTGNSFQLVTKVEFLPKITNLTSSLNYWAWEGQVIQILGANQPIDVKLDYIGTVIAPVTSSASVIQVFNSKSYLAYRTAALCAEYIGENKTRADALNMQAERALNKLLGLTTKSRQGIYTRRRPFMAHYKSSSGGSF